MSHASYENAIKLKAIDLEYLARNDANFSQEISQAQDRLSGSALADKLEYDIGMRFVKYIQIYKTLDEACFQIVQPQKVAILQKLLTAVIGRLLELKDELVTVTGTDYHLFDQLLFDHKLTPYDIQIPPPRVHQKQPVLEKIRIQIENSTTVSKISL